MLVPCLVVVFAYLQSYKPDSKQCQATVDAGWPNVAQRLSSLVPSGVQQVHMPEWLVAWCLKPATPGSTAHSSTGTSTDTSTRTASNNSAQISLGFAEWTSQLRPTKREQQGMKATVSEVCTALQDICKTQTWSVQVLPVGSCKKKTSLRGS